MICPINLIYILLFHIYYVCQWDNKVLLTVIIPVSNSNPLSWKVWQHPPAWSCCSSTSTFLPARASRAPTLRPPMPLPMITASKFLGTLWFLNPWENVKWVNYVHPHCWIYIAFYRCNINTTAYWCNIYRASFKNISSYFINIIVW